MKKKTLLYVLFFIAFAGLLISTYLTTLQYSQVDSICDFNGQFSCSTVSESSYAKIMGIPISVLGLIGYGFFTIVPLFFLLKFDFKRIHKKLSNIFVVKGYFLLSIISLIFSLYLTYLELRTINVICPFCLLSQVLIIVIVFFSYITYKKFNIN
jgi:uncharacterized membrane protein